jgi:hypothetical protein
MRIKIYIIICVYTLTKINHNIEKNALNNTTRCINIHILILSYTSQMNKINKLVLEIRSIFFFGTRTVFTCLDFMWLDNFSKYLVITMFLVSITFEKCMGVKYHILKCNFKVLYFVKNTEYLTFYSNDDNDKPSDKRSVHYKNKAAPLRCLVISNK